MTRIEAARAFAVHAHRSTNHLYDGQPYERHLEIVNGYVVKHRNLILSDYEVVASAGWLHDVIEDCRITYSDLKKEFGLAIAELVYALTNEKGRTRKDRANAVYYSGISKVTDAAFLKICDRLANIHYSLSTESKMAGVYRKEAEEFERWLCEPFLKPMFDEMNILLFNNSRLIK